MNDWEIRKFLKVVLAIQLALWSVIGLDTIGLHIPILRQLIGFIFLIFVPGILILRILRLHKLGDIETLLYTVGLSIAVLMFTGCFVNVFYPFFGISKPISFVPLIITISMIVLVLCVLCYIRDKEFSEPVYIDVKEILSPPALFLCLIPLLAVLGTYFVNFHNTNILLMFLIVIIALTAIIIGFDKFIPSNLYPLAVFMISISLLYHTSLISMYIWGWDIHYELYLVNLTKMNSIWDPTLPDKCNAMLSIIMLAPFLSIISNMETTWVFKIIYPLVFSLIPLCLYRIFQKQINDRVAFLSCFFFVSYGVFYLEMIQLARQQVAELFFVLFILLMVDNDMDKVKQSFLFIVFGISLAVSHYGLSYIFMFSLIAVWIILVLVEKAEIQRWINKFHYKSDIYNNLKLMGNSIPSKIEGRTIKSTYVLLFITFTIMWYMYVSSSISFNTIVSIGNQIASSIFTEFLDPEASPALNVIVSETISPLHNILKYLHLLSQLFISVGILTLLLKHKATGFKKEYSAFSAVNYLICLATIALPFASFCLGTTRLYHITLFFLAPFCIIGGITVLNVISRAFKVAWTNQCMNSSLYVLSIFLAIFLLFNSGWVYEITKDHPGSIALSQESVGEYGDAGDINAFYATYYTDRDIAGVEWISKYHDNYHNYLKAYADLPHLRILNSYGMIPQKYLNLLTNSTELRDGSYTYLGYSNIHYGLLYGEMHGKKYWNITYISPLLKKQNKIYSNGGSNILWI